MPNHIHRHPHVKHLALRTLGAGAVVGWRTMRLAVRRAPAPRTRVALVSEGRVLLIQNVTNFRKWTLPGGGYHKAETALDCAQRELREEIGVDIDKSAFTSTGRFTEDQRGTIYHYDTFVAIIPRIPDIKITWELSHAQWVPLDQLPENVVPFVPKLLKKAGVL